MALGFNLFKSLKIVYKKFKIKIYRQLKLNCKRVFIYSFNKSKSKQAVKIIFLNLRPSSNI